MPKKMFYQDERECIKATIAALNDGPAMDYFEALEAIAKAAYDTWAYAGTDATVLDRLHNDLYDALSVVNFMDEND